MCGSDSLVSLPLSAAEHWNGTRDDAAEKLLACSDDATDTTPATRGEADAMAADASAPPTRVPEDAAAPNSQLDANADVDARDAAEPRESPMALDASIRTPTADTSPG